MNLFLWGTLFNPQYLMSQGQYQVEASPLPSPSLGYHEHDQRWDKRQILETLSLSWNSDLTSYLLWDLKQVTHPLCALISSHVK